MPLYVGIHKLSGNPNDEAIKNSWAEYKDSCEKKGAKAVRVGYNIEKAVAHCVTEAPSENEVKAAHVDMGQIPDEIFEIKTLD